jgi:hypothetical protein
MSGPRGALRPAERLLHDRRERNLGTPCRTTPWRESMADMEAFVSRTIEEIREGVHAARDV